MRSAIGAATMQTSEAAAARASAVGTAFAAMQVINTTAAKNLGISLFHTMNEFGKTFRVGATIASEAAEAGAQVVLDHLVANGALPEDAHITNSADAVVAPKTVAKKAHGSLVALPAIVALFALVAFGVARAHKRPAVEPEAKMADLV